MLLKSLFALLIVIHALIHFRGFFNSFSYDAEDGKTSSIIIAVFWILTSLLLATAAIFFLVTSEKWPVVLLATVALSQILIISHWKEARPGTIINIILIGVAVPAFANMRFQQRVDREVESLLRDQRQAQQSNLSPVNVAGLPPIVQKWLQRSGMADLDPVNYARIKQRGKMRLQPGGGWKSFNAEEYITTAEPAFLWNSSVQMFPLLYFNGRDKLQNGKGEMLVKGLSLVNMVNEKPGDKINEGSLQRFLGELVWIPSVALNKYITWETINDLLAKATITSNGRSASGIFHFTEAGDVSSFTTNRFYKTKNGYTKEKWVVQIKDHKTFNGVRVPSVCEITWKLPGGDFNWMVLEITGVTYAYSPAKITSYETK